MKIKSLLTSIIIATCCIFFCACSVGPKINTNKIDINTKIESKDLIEQDVLKVAIASDNQPFEYFKSVQPNGFDVSLAYQIANDLGLYITFQNMDFNDVLNAVKDKKADIALSAIEIIPERSKLVDFTNPYYEDVKCFISKINKHIEGSKIDSILQDPNTIVVCQHGSTCENFIKENYPKIKLITKTTNDECFAVLKSDEANLFLNEKSYAQSKLGNEFEIIKETSSYEKYGIAVNKSSSNLTKAINEILEARFNDGTIDRFKEQIK